MKQATKAITDILTACGCKPAATINKDGETVIKVNAPRRAANKAETRAAVRASVGDRLPALMMAGEKGKAMICYAVKRINLKHVNNVNEYWEAVKNATVHYCNGIIELKEYCGGTLHRERNGYSGICGNIMYIAEKV